VWADDDGGARIAPESPRQCITASAPGDRRVRTAGLKRWLELDGTARAILYLPDVILPFRSASTVATLDYNLDPASMPLWTSAIDWVPDGDPIPNPLGVVPLVPIVNRPQIVPTDLVTGDGRSEVLDILPLQDMLNKVVADMIVASEFSSFRQKWASGVDVPVDPETNPPIEPFNAAVSRAWMSEKPDAKFGTFDTTSLQNYTNAVEMIVQHISSISRVPAHYFRGGSADRLSGESIRSAESGLISKVRRKQEDYAESFEEAMQIAFAVVGRTDQIDAEVVWSDPEFRTEAEHADALVKRASLGVPQEQIWEDAGYTPAQIARFRTMRRTQALDTAPPLAFSALTEGGAPSAN
jgi:hypothetical protein